MRVISGLYRGRQLISPPDNTIRPTKDMVKEAIFGKLQFLLPESTFIDLFSGSGAMGIEAVSRGASKVYFNDSSRNAIATIKENLQNLNISADVLDYDYKDILKVLKDKRVNFILADPPYALDCINDILKISVEYDTIMVGGMIIYEHDRARAVILEDSNYELVSSKNYSATTITYFKRIK